MGSKASAVPVSDPHSSYREIWSRKPILRLVYQDYYRRIAAMCVPGETIEIGGGIGQLKGFIPAAWSSDIQHSPMVDIVARELRVRHDMLVVGTAWSRFGHPDGLPTGNEGLYGIHGGEIETSVMLHLRPDLVRMEHATDFRSTQLAFIDEFAHLRAHGTTQFGWKAQDLNRAGVVGNAAAATAEKGRAVVDHQAKAFVELCADVNAFDFARLWIQLP